MNTINWVEAVESEFSRLGVSDLEMGEHGFTVFDKGDSEAVLWIYDYEGDNHMVYADQFLENLNGIRVLDWRSGVVEVMEILEEIKEALVKASV